jgi:hypothetical protein
MRLNLFVLQIFLARFAQSLHLNIYSHPLFSAQKPTPKNHLFSAISDVSSLNLSCYAQVKVFASTSGEFADPAGQHLDYRA